MKIWIAALLALCTVACTPVQTTAPGAIGVDRKQYMLVSEENIEKSAAAAYRQELDAAGKKGALNKDPAQLQKVKTISGRLIPQVKIFRPDAAQWQWEVNVQSTDELNAYCMPGGKIMVYSGIIDKLQLNDAELAAIIGHEMAHALREHTRERVSRAYGQQVLLGIGAIATGAGDAMMQAAGQLSQVFFTLPHSREQEAEADRIGLELMARGGYDPNAAVSLWQKMSREAGDSSPSFLSTHPSSGDRIKDLQGNVPKVLPLYRAAGKG